jgi:hypothetical protein
MIFLDGVGIGSTDPAVNPLFAATLPALRRILGNDLFSLHHCEIRTPHTSLLPLNATLGVAGLPQSGTGQTALFTGENAARLLGRHFGPFPYSTLRPLIAKNSIFRLLVAHGLSPAFANTYPQRYFDYITLHPTRMTVAPYACLQSGVRLLEAADLAEGRGISADITGAGWHSLGYPHMEVITHVEAGRRLVALLDGHEFVLFEYWKTDHAGHAQNQKGACDVLHALDGMLCGVLEAMDLRRDLLVMTSDHGNLEDLKTKTHTRHPVPMLLHGHRHLEMAARLAECGSGAPTLCAVTPALMRLFTADSG